MKEVFSSEQEARIAEGFWAAWRAPHDAVRDLPLAEAAVRTAVRRKNRNDSAMDFTVVRSIYMLHYFNGATS
jgi:hypothetical protein